MDVINSLSPIDLFVGFFSFLAGSVAMIQKFKRNPMRNAGLFLQVSLMLIKMAQYYFKSHPEARQKLNDKTINMLEKVSRQMEDYKQARSSIKLSEGPLG